MTPEAVHSVISEVVASSADGMLGGSLQIAQRGGSARGQNAAQGVGNLAQVRLRPCASWPEPDPMISRTGKKVRMEE